MPQSINIKEIKAAISVMGMPLFTLAMFILLEYLGSPISFIGLAIAFAVLTILTYMTEKLSNTYRMENEILKKRLTRLEQDNLRSKIELNKIKYENDRINKHNRALYNDRNSSTQG